MSLKAGGLNCWGLVKTVAARMGLQIPDFDDFVDLGAEKIETQLQEGIEKFIRDFVRVDEPQPGDVIAFAVGGDDTISHVGIVIDQTWFLHCREGAGVRMSRIKSPLWGGFIRGYYRWTK